MGGRDREDALSEIIGFVLILALIVVASTLYLMYVVPAEGREDEIEHMNQVKDRFVSYKTSVDGLWLRSLGDLSISGTRGVSLSTSFDLGTGGGNTQSSGLFLSFMRPIGTAARMTVETRPEHTDNLTLIVNGTEQILGEVSLGSLRYTTDNYYWIQQSYLYEMGGVFLEQTGEGVSVKVAPSLSLYRAVNGSNSRKAAKMSLAVVNVTGTSRTIGGTGPLRVETRLRENFNPTLRDKPIESVLVRVNSSSHMQALAWQRVFLDAAQRSTLKADTEAGDEPKYRVSEPVSSDISHRVEFEVQNLSAGSPPAMADVFLDLTEANLQVTFEYDE